MITERTLRNWRRDALQKLHNPLLISTGKETNIVVLLEKEYCERILRLTQELMDQRLLMKGGKS
jgi:hypothetical protein